MKRPVEGQARQIVMTHEGQAALSVSVPCGSKLGMMADSTLRCRFRLIRCPSAPVVLILVELQGGAAPEQLPVPVDVADVASFRALRRLTCQFSLAVQLTDQDGAPLGTRELSLSTIDRLRLHVIIREAIRHYRSIPPDLRNFELARKYVWQAWRTSFD